MYKSEVERLSEIMGHIEERETDIENGLDALDVIGNEYFLDGTEGAYINRQTTGGKDRFARTSNALLFAGKAMREALDSLRDAADALYRKAREHAEALEEQERAEAQ